MLINFSRLNNFSISFRCILSSSFSVELCPAFKNMHIYYQKKLYIFLSLETKRCLECKREWQKNTQKQTHTRISVQRRVAKSQCMCYVVWCGVELSATNAVWNGKPSECFKNTIKTKTRVHRKKLCISFQNSQFVHNFVRGCCLATALVNFFIVVDSFHHGFFLNNFFLFDCVFFFDFEFIFVTVDGFVCMCVFPFSLYHRFFRLLFYVLKLFYDYYSVDI